MAADMCHVDVTGVHLISIPAPPRGATVACSNVISAPPYFNSRPSVRGDFVQNNITMRVTKFQFTPLREGRLNAIALSNGSSDFNSRPSARGDTSGSQGRLGRCYFNSRPSARGDDYRVIRSGSATVISIPAPPQGATVACSNVISAPPYFNSRPSVRGDFVQNSITMWVTKFQFTPLREGRRLSSAPQPAKVDISIPAPPQGATP